MNKDNEKGVINAEVGETKKVFFNPAGRKRMAAKGLARGVKGKAKKIHGDASQAFQNILNTTKYFLSLS